MKKKISLEAAVLLVAVLLLLNIAPIQATQHPNGTNLLYTLDEDFDKGVLMNVNHDAPNNDQLQLNVTATPFPYVNIAASARGTIVRIDVNTGEILGEYLTAPDGMGRDPSRTTVDQQGNVWVANRQAEGWGKFPVKPIEPVKPQPEPEPVPVEPQPEVKGSVARIGLIIGGTRVDAAGNSDPNGQYLAPPFGYNTCVDRDSDSLIKTSYGLGNFLAWTNTSDADTLGGVSTAEDECIINYTRVTGTGTRTLAVDANNDVWVGGLNNQEHEKLDGVTGLPIPGTQINFGCGGYGGLIDANGVLWSARSPILRFDPSTMTGTCVSTVPGAYGLGIDPNTGNIWVSELGGTGSVYELDPADGSVLNSYPLPFWGAQGIAVDGNSHVWVAEIFGDEVAHYAPDPANPGQHILVGTVTGFAGTTGVAVDANGKIWASEMSGNSASRINPNAGSIGGSGYNVGAIDMTVSLGWGAWPYNYSDMTGFVAIGATSPLGTWTVIQNSGAAGTNWGTITWNAEIEGKAPAGSSITVEARTADTMAGLSSQTFVAVFNGDPFNLTGQYIEVRVTLTLGTATQSPVLSDIRIQAAEIEVPADIKPGSCRNPLNVNDKNVLPAAILGTLTFDVTKIDVSTVKLEGVSPSRSSLEDVATPFVPFVGKEKATDCTTARADGFMDLTLKFDNQAIVSALGTVTDKEVRVLKLTGNLKPEFGGIPIVGEDVVVILKKSKI